MNKNIIQFIVDENGQYISIPVGRVKAKSNLTTRIQLVTPITASVAVNYLIYDSKNIEKKQYLIKTGDLGSAVVNPSNPNYQLVAGWKVYEADIYAPILSVISKYKTGKVGMSFEFVEQVPNALCTNFIGYFGFTKPLPQTASNGDYYICEDYNFWIGENLYNKGDILAYYDQEWHNGGILPKGLSETVDISVDPAISYPTEEVNETAFDIVIGEIAEDVAELDTRLDGVEADLNGKQDKVDALIETTNKTVVGAINELNSDVNILDSQVTDLAETKQNKTDNDLDTTSKTVVGAINELNTHTDIIDGELTNLDGKINNVDNKVDNVNNKVDNVNNKVDNVDNKVDNVNNKVELIIPKANGAVRFDITQTLSESEKSRARINIGVSGSGKIDMIIVNELPEVGEPSTIYLLPNENPESSNLYTEWIYINEEWEMWGVSNIDLSNYISYTQDDSNAGKTFVVGEDGIVELVDFPTISVNGIDYLKDPDKTYLVIKTPADNDTFTLLTGTTGAPNYTIEWGDGTSEAVMTIANPTHKYETAGMYLITISGAFENGITGINVNVNKNKIIEVYGGSNYPLSIVNTAFDTCTSLTTANFPNATSIGDVAFNECTSLTTANFPNATSIGSNAFSHCQSLTTASFPSATSIGDTAFNECTSLTTANFPNATSIGNTDFYDCPSLTTANFPNATSIGNVAFRNCTSLTTASFPKATSIGNSAFNTCPSLTTANFPNATSIGNSAFSICPSLTTANFPKATNIETAAFRNCTSLKELTLGNVTTTNTGSAFTGVKLINLKIAQDVTNTDINRIKQFYADNGGTFAGLQINSRLQVAETPTADLDVVRKVDLTSAIGDINTILDEINGEVV